MSRPTSLVARLLAPRQLVFEESDLPDPGVGEIQAIVEWSAISPGTEKAAWTGAPALRPGTGYPRLVGYCNVGRVVRAGEGVIEPRVGQLVLTHQSHRSAFTCRATDVLAVLPASLDPQVASLAYLAQLGLASLQKVRAQPGERVAVIGLGILGLSTIALLRASGAVPVAVGNSDSRLALARQLGAEETIRSTSDGALPTGTLDQPGRLCAVVVNTVNSWTAWRAGLELAAPFGRIAVLGFPGRGEGPPTLNPFDSSLFYVKQLTVAAAGMPPPDPSVPMDEQALGRRNIATILSLMLSGRLELGHLISHRVLWRDLPAVYERMASGDKSLIGVVLDWHNDAMSTQ